MGDLHPDMQAMLDRRTALGLPGFAEGSVADARRSFAEAQAALPRDRGAKVAAIEDMVIAGPRGSIGLRRYTPLTRKGDGAILYLHGGGWVFGTLGGFDPVCRQLANASGFDVVSVDYGLAPENPFPGPLDDAWAALLVVANMAGPIMVAGDSAGGNLAAALALRARERGGPAIALQLLAYPVLSPDFDRPSYQRYGAGQHFITRSDMMWFWDHYADPAVRAHPEATPLAAQDLAGLPPAILVIGACDPLRDEGVAYAEALRSAGGEVVLREHPGMAHGFLTLVDLLPAANAEVDAVGALIAEKIAAA